jgi:large subunit ribosomal protein L23
MIKNIPENRLLHIILKPHLSEKSTIAAEKNRHFVFKVLRDATKVEIKQAVELLFKVEVNAVRVCNVKGKTRRFKQQLGQRKDWKKAYVTLKAGDDIDFTGNK